jgi:uncharacterized cupredoxin-like copper-binding protein
MRIAVFATALLLTLACSREAPDVTQSGPSASSTTTDVQPTQMTDTSASSPTAASATQEVHLIEYAIHMPDTLPAGRVSFNVENGGKETHAFEIEGNGIEEKTSELSAGNSAALEVELRPGTYTIYCPVKGHRGKGMEKKVTVQ